MKITALINVYNEEHVIKKSLDHLRDQGIDFYIIDNGSTDQTKHIIEQYDFVSLLKHKESLAASLDTDWFIHHDADEFRTSNLPGETLASAIARIDAQGFNAINFQELTFIPTAEHPYHEPDSFIETMRWYYPFLPAPLHRVNAWKAGIRDIDLAANGGHRVVFPEIRIFPESLWMRHYLYISHEHFLYKYSNRRHHQADIDRGWHGWREKADDSRFYCPSERLLREFYPETPWLMDASEPLIKHMLEEAT
jgi:glycosyltransferase involved in cell wall biosynthesis